MHLRTTSVALCLAVLVAVSLPAGVAAAAQDSGETSEDAETDEDGALEPICIPAPVLQDVTMNAHEQTAENLQTEDGTVSTGGQGPDERETFEVDAGEISADENCFADLNPQNDVIELRIHDAEFEDTSLTGPRTDIEFAEGEADTMTLVLPYEEALLLIAQLPTSIDVVETLKQVLEDEFGVDFFDEDENSTESETDDDDDDDLADPPENATEPINETTNVADETVDRTTDAVDETVNSTTDAVDTVTGGVLDNTTDAVDETVDTTTDAVDETVGATTSAIGGLVESDDAREADEHE